MSCSLTEKLLLPAFPQCFFRSEPALAGQVQCFLSLMSKRRGSKNVPASAQVGTRGSHGCTWASVKYKIKHFPCVEVLVHSSSEKPGRGCHDELERGSVGWCASPSTRTGLDAAPARAAPKCTVSLW